MGRARRLALDYHYGADHTEAVDRALGRAVRAGGRFLIPASGALLKAIDYNFAVKSNMARGFTKTRLPNSRKRKRSAPARAVKATADIMPYQRLDYYGNPADRDWETAKL